MEWKKNVNTNLGITIILVFSALLTVIGFYIVGAHLDGYPFNELNETIDNSNSVVEDKDNSFVDDENGSAVDVENSILVYDYYKENLVVDKEFKVRSTNYNVYIDGKIIKLNDKEVFKTNDFVKKVYIIKDIVGIEISKDNSDKSNLVFVDFDGNVIKSVNDVVNFKVHNFYIFYEFNNHVNDDSNVIYKMRLYDSVSIKYIGDYRFSDEEHHDSQEGISSDNYVFYDKDNLKIQYIAGCDLAKSNGASSCLRINGKDVPILTVVINITKLSDNYLFVESSYFDGSFVDSFIADTNGNVTTTFNKLVRKDERNIFILIGNEKIYDNGVFTIHTGLSEYVSWYIDEVCSISDKSAVLGRKYQFKYLGNGTVDNGTLIDEITVAEYLDYHKDACQ